MTSFPGVENQKHFIDCPNEKSVNFADCQHHRNRKFCEDHERIKNKQIAIFTDFIYMLCGRTKNHSSANLVCASAKHKIQNARVDAAGAACGHPKLGTQ